MEKEGEDEEERRRRRRRRIKVTHRAGWAFDPPPISASWGQGRPGERFIIGRVELLILGITGRLPSPC